MEFFITAAALVFLVFMYPYLRIFVKRVKAITEIKSACVKNGYGFFRASGKGVFSGNGGARCDYYVETENTVYSIKLFAVKRRRCALVFNAHGGYFYRGHIITAINKSNSGIKKLTAFDFRYKFRDGWYLKNFRQVLLVCPVCMEIKRTTEGGGEVTLGSGENINGMTVYSVPGFIGEMGSLSRGYDEFI